MVAAGWAISEHSSFRGFLFSEPFAAVGAVAVGFVARHVSFSFVQRRSCLRSTAQMSLL